MLYVGKIDAGNKELMDVFIEDKRGEEIVSTIVASRGKLFSDPENLAFRMRLLDGSINQVDIKNRSVNSIQFDTYDVRLSIKELIQGKGDRPKNRKEMSLGEMRDFLRTSQKKDWNYNKTLVDYHKKFSIPLASLILGLIAVPLGIQSEVRKRSSGFAFGLVVFLVYYILLSIGTGFGKSGDLPPLFGIWVPNVVMGSMAVIFIFRSGRERPLLSNSLMGAAGHLIDRLIRRIGSKTSGRKTED